MSVALLTADDMRRTLGRMAHEIAEANRGAGDIVALGILRHGYPVAKRLAFALTQIEGVTVPCGSLDASVARDDRPGDGVDRSDIPFGITGKNVILVDEVLHTGRTVRAALDALLRHGRPRTVQLAVLIDRGYRELPIQPNYVGRSAATKPDDYIMVKVKEVDGVDEVVLMDAQERLATR